MSLDGCAAASRRALRLPAGGRPRRPTPACRLGPCGPLCDPSRLLRLACRTARPDQGAVRAPIAQTALNYPAVMRSFAWVTPPCDNGTLRGGPSPLWPAVMGDFRAEHPCGDATPSRISAYARYGTYLEPVEDRHRCIRRGVSAAWRTRSLKRVFDAPPAAVPFLAAFARLSTSDLGSSTTCPQRRPAGRSALSRTRWR